MKRILVLGSNGYIGNALMWALNSKYKVMGVDSDIREYLVEREGGKSLTPIKKHPDTKFCDIGDYEEINHIIQDFKPDAIVHLAEQPSAPYSMKGPLECTNTQTNNIKGTLNILWAIKNNPDIHLIKLGTAGEYPDWLYPEDVTIPESSRMKVLNMDDEGHMWEIPTPRYGGSWYHFSKLHDSNNIDYACRIWGIRATDINQSPVWGHKINTRFDYDECFGTVVNRFIVQAVCGMPLTVYGEGEQQRGFIHLKSALKAIKIVIENPPQKGEFRVIHQLTETKTIKEVAKLVQGVTGCKINYIENPRAEMKRNRFKFECKFLKKHGLKPIVMTEGTIEEMVSVVEGYRDHIIKDVINPKIKWN